MYHKFEAIIRYMYICNVYREPTAIQWKAFVCIAGL